MKAHCLFLVLLSFCSCGENCVELPNVFSDYNEAIEKVESYNFVLTDNADCSESAWIHEASFYSCDEDIGFFIYSTNSKKYIHCNVPINVWEGFKVAKSKGSFYNQYIKNRYQCEIKK